MIIAILITAFVCGGVCGVVGYYLGKEDGQDAMKHLRQMDKMKVHKIQMKHTSFIPDSQKHSKFNNKVYEYLMSKGFIKVDAFSDSSLYTYIFYTKTNEFRT